MQTECEADNISRRYIDNGISKEGRNSSKGQCNIFSPNFGVFDQQKRIFVTPTPDLRLLGVEINSKEMGLSLPQEKKDKIISQHQSF